MRSNIEKFVGRYSIDKAWIIAANIWLEYVMIKMIGVLIPSPEHIIKAGKANYSFIISLCEAHNALSPDMAAALKLIGRIRNKSAHVGGYDPQRSDFCELRRLVENIGKTYGEPLDLLDESDDDYDDNQLISALAMLLEKRAREIGVQVIDADHVVQPSKWEIQYFK